MEIKGKVTIPARKEERVIAIECDICHRRGKDGFESNESDWSKSHYEVSNTTIRYEYGSHYPEGKSTKVEFFNICPGCWGNILSPLLQNYGADLNKSNSED